MKPSKSRGRKILAAAGIVAVVLIGTVATLPLWFRGALRPVLKHYGVRFETYRAIGYNRFALEGVRGEFAGVRFESARLESDLPTRWIWRRFFRKDAGPPILQCANWILHFEELKKSEPQEAARAGGVSTFDVLQWIEAIRPRVRTWLPSVQLTNGAVEFGSERIELPAFDWQSDRIAATLQSKRFKEAVELRADLSTNGFYTLSARAKSGLAVDVRLKRAGDRWKVEGDTSWRSNRVEMTAEFAPQGSWPLAARATADSFIVPAELLKLEGYDDLRGSFVFNWGGDHFQLDLSAQAKPTPGSDDQYPAVALTLRAGGDKDSAAIEALRLVGPGMQADLSDSVRMTRSGKLLSEAASLNLSIDLAKLPWISTQGKLEGLVRIQPAESGYPLVSFDLSGAGLIHENLALDKVSLAGALTWPLLEVRRAEAKFTDASIFAGSVQVDLKSRIVSDGRWQFHGHLPSGWTPEGLRYSTLQTTGEFRGPLGQPIHSGQLAVEGLSVPYLNSCDVQASWRGEKFNLSAGEAQFSAGTSKLSLAGAGRLVEAKDLSTTIALQTLTFQRSTQTLYALQQPCEVFFRRTPGKTPGWELKTSALRWGGPPRRISLDGDVEWPRRGDVVGHFQAVSLDDFADFAGFARLRARSCLVSNLDLSAKWTNAPMEFALSGQGSFSAREGAPFSAQVRMRGDAAGLKVDQLDASEPSGVVVSVHGQVPVTVVPRASTNWLRWDDEKSIDLRATTVPNKSFWDGVAGIIGVRLSKPELDLTVRGSLARPEGLLRLNADGLGWTSNRVWLPTLENLRVEASFKRERLQLETFAVELEGQPVFARGEVPLGKNFWNRLLVKGELPNWEEASGRIEIVDGRLALFAKYLPNVLSSQGRLSLALDIHPGAKLAGELQITNASTRPLMPLGQIHDISAQIRFEDRGAKIEQFSGQIGGELVALAGHVRLVDKSGIQFEAALRGTNVPLIREPGMLLRSDLAVRLAGKGDEAPTVSGDVTLRDSLFLQDVKSLMAVGPNRQSQRPPYFSVDVEPFADWKLNVRVKGDKFLRVRTPLFRGEISADFLITGPMRDPVAFGEARVASGRVQLPFGTLTVEQGSATLTSENPYRPALFIVASTRAYGYGIRMEVSGPADLPRITFSSTPPLTSEQVVLMLTAGELPRDEGSFSRQQRATRLGMFLGKDFVSRWMGDEKAAERLTIRSGEDFSDEGKPTYSLEYRLTDRWSVVGEYDRFNALNAGLKWKIFSK